LVDAIRAIAQGKGATVAQVAIAWVVSRGEEIVPLVGGCNYHARVSDSVHLRLCKVLQDDPVPEVRTEAARALGVTGEADQSIEPLVEALDDSSDGVRRAATLALGRIADPRAIEALITALAERPELWQEASAALASAKDPGLLDRLVPLLDSDSSHVRSGAVRAIAAVSSSTRQAESEPVFEYTDDEGHRHILF
jgi:HEAT repeat protein